MHAILESMGLEGPVLWYLNRSTGVVSIVLLTLCYAINTTVMAVITQRWKISAHAAGAALPATALFAAFGTAALAFAVVVPMVCWARVRVKMHTVWQVTAGALLGWALTWLQLSVLAPRF